MMYNYQNKIIVICGSTAVGKSSFALRMALDIDGVIINGDAMQIYKEVPILTAQPSVMQQKQCQHLLYGIVDLNEKFSVMKWLDLAVQTIHRTRQENKIPIIVGGSGLYLKSLIDGIAHIPAISIQTEHKTDEMFKNFSSEEIYMQLLRFDPELAKKIHHTDIKRMKRGINVFTETGIPISTWQKNNKTFFPRKEFYVINMIKDRNILYHDCDLRFDNMIKEGVIEEVLNIQSTLDTTIQHQKIIGLAEIQQYIQKKISFEEMVKYTKQFVRNYAKRQITWFKHQIQFDQVIDARNQ